MLGMPGIGGDAKDPSLGRQGATLYSSKCFLGYPHLEGFHVGLTRVAIGSNQSPEECCFKGHHVLVGTQKSHA